MTSQARRPGGHRGEAVTVLTAYVVLLLAVPATMVFSAMGQAGGPSTLVAVGCLLWWSWQRVHRAEPWDGGAQPVRNAALVFLLVITVVFVHSAGLALPADERASADGALIRLAGSIGLVCVMAEGVADREKLWTFCRRWILAIGGVSALAVIQIATGQVWVNKLVLPGLTPPEGLALIQRGLILRPSGTATHPIEFSAMLAMTMPLAFAVAGRETVRPRLFRAIAVSVPIVILLTGSRTALVCGAAGFLVMLFSWPPRTRLLAGAAAVLVLAVMFVALPGFLGSIKGLFSGASSDPSVSSRTDSYHIVAIYWDHHRWLGRGVGTFLPRYWIFDNMYLNLLVGGGVVILVALAMLLAVAGSSALRAARLSGTPADRQLGVAALAGVLAGAISLALFDAFSFPQATGTLFLMIGLCGAVYRQARADRDLRRPRAPVSTGSRTDGSGG